MVKIELFLKGYFRIIFRFDFWQLFSELFLGLFSEWFLGIASIRYVGTT